MRFAATHKTTSYLAVAFAFLAMVGGGAVSPLLVLGGALGLALSWFIEPPRWNLDRFAWLFTVIAALGLVYSALLAVSTGDYLGHGGGFLIILTVARASTRRAARDWQQLYLLAFLMLVAGSVLNGELGYAVCFFGFVVTGTWALILFHLRREMEDNFLLRHADPRASQRVEIRRILESRRIVDRRFLLGTGLTSVGFFIVAVIFFLSIPRVGTGFFFRGQNSLHMVGFSDGVKLGGHGRLKTDSTIVMRVQVSAKEFHGRRAPYLYWRGVVFDHYGRGEWTRTRSAPSTPTWTEPLPGNRERRYLRLPGISVGSEAAMAVARANAVQQDVWLEPIGADVLFAASAPLAFEVAPPTAGGRRPLEKNDEIRLRHDGPVHYRAWSYIEPPAAEALAATWSAPPGSDALGDPYRQLPPEITAATRAKAAEIVAGATSDYAKAVKLRDWLQTQLRYSLDLRDPGGREPIDYFLFERQAGHCEYFASAFAVMGRAVGLRTRSVNGFLGGEWNEYDGYIAVRAGDAHSWSEVYFEGQGWVTFDATPPGEADQLGRGSGAWTAKLRRWFDTLRFQWNKWVIDYDLTQQLSLFRSIGKKLSGGGRAVSSAGKAVTRFAKRWAALGGALALLAAVAWYWRRTRGRRRPTAPTRAERERSELARLYEKAARRLAQRPAAVTPRELARQLAERGAAGAAALEELTEIYYAGQWGGAVGDDALARARVLAADIDAAARAARR
jgi:transglutaminase-like putative cysteine protease